MGLSILLLNHIWLKPELEALGHRVISAGWSNASFDISCARPARIESLLARVPADIKIDRIVYLDDSYPVNVLGLEDCNIPSLLLSVDTHHHYGWHRAFASVFSKTFIAQKRYLGEFASYWPSAKGAATEWLPLWAPHVLQPEAEKTIDVCFRGTLDAMLHPKRSAFFKRLKALVPVDAAEGPYQRAYPKAKIVVNQAVRGDLNFRVFEALMSGTLLITPGGKNGTTDLFTAGEDLVLYEEDNADQAAELIRYYLSHEEERKRIAETGRRKVLELHTPTARAKKLEETLLKLEVADSVYRYLGAATAYLNAIVTLSYGPGADDPRERPSEMLNEFFHYSIKSLLQAAERPECSVHELEVFYLLCKAFLDDQRRNSEALDFSRAIAHLFPANATFMLHFLDSLLTSGKESEARECAAVISTSPSELLAHVPKLLKDAKDQVLQAVAQSM